MIWVVTITTLSLLVAIAYAIREQRRAQYYKPNEKQYIYAIKVNGMVAAHGMASESECRYPAGDYLIEPDCVDGSWVVDPSHHIPHTDWPPVSVSPFAVCRLVIKEMHVEE